MEENIYYVHLRSNVPLIQTFIVKEKHLFAGTVHNLNFKNRSTECFLLGDLSTLPVKYLHLSRSCESECEK